MFLSQEVFCKLVLWILEVTFSGLEFLKVSNLRMMQYPSIFILQSSLQLYLSEEMNMGP